MLERVTGNQSKIIPKIERSNQLRKSRTGAELPVVVRVPDTTPPVKIS